MNRIVGFALGLVVALQAVAATPVPGPFLCIVNQSTGFAFDKQSKSWRRANFAPGDKYVLKRVPNSTLEGFDQTIAGSDHAVWGIWPFGVNHLGEAFCAEDVNDHGYLFCHGVQQIFNVNLRSGRFLRTYAGSYVNESSAFADDEHSDTPVIEIGECTAL